jgi:hypothetical protein
MQNPHPLKKSPLKKWGNAQPSDASMPKPFGMQNCIINK